MHVKDCWEEEVSINETFLKASDVEPTRAKKALAFLNAAKTAEEIAATIEFPGEKDVGIKVAQNILAKRQRLGGFKELRQVAQTQ